MKRAIVFDGNSLLNRAFYGVRPLSNSKGLPTNAVYGFVNILRSVLKESPDFAVIAFDVKAPTFRHKACDFYKATRKPMPDELRVQFPYAKKAAEALGLRIVELEGYEADDVLGTFSELFSKDGIACDLVTGDRDSYQLITDRVRVLYATDRGTVVTDEAAIAEKYGVTPKQLIDVKALMGDSSDNIPGVAGIGEKGALKLIAEYGTLDGVYEHSDEIKGALHDKLQNGKESAYTSRFLAEIVKNAPVGTELSDCAYRGEKTEALRELFTELEFRKFLEQLDQTSPAPAAECRECKEFPPCDAEVFWGKAVLFAAAEEDGVKLYDGETCGKVGLESAAKLLAGTEKTVWWSVKDAIAAFREKGIALGGTERAEDVSLLAYLAALSDGATTYEGTAFRLTGQTVQGGIDPTLLETMREKLTAMLAGTPRETLYREVELPLALLLADMEGRGFLLDRDALETLGTRYVSEMKELESAIYTEAGKTFNLNSPAQLGTLLFEERGLPHGKKLKSGKYSTDAEILEGLAEIDPLVRMILEYRKVAKLQSTYIEGLRKEISDDGRVHTTFRQTLTMTGRLSSAEPNLQNIPVRTERGRELRKLFIAPEGKKLIDADYSQIELRLMAHISGDETLTQAFRDGADIHRSTAAGVFGVAPEEVTDGMRKFAKTVNFGILYGMGEYSLSKDLSIPVWQAKQYIEQYFARYPKIREYMESVKAFAREHLYVETMYGRRRSIPEMAQTNKTRLAAAERVAMNTPIQGAAADLIKIAMVRVEKALEAAGLQAKIVLQIHDELIVECPDGEVDRAKEILTREMEHAAALSVPLAVEAGVGRSWEEAH